MKKERLNFIDCARALCMLWIIGFWHLSGYINTDYNISNPFSIACTNGVLATFTFISAYFLGQKSIRSLSDILSFWKSRILRIYPLFFLSCTTLLLINIFYNINYISSVKQYVLTLLGIAVFVGEAPQTIWFVSMLILFYAFTPFILLTKSEYRIVILVTICVLFYTLNIIIPGFETRVALLFPFYAAGLVLPQWKRLDSKFSISFLVIGSILFGGFALMDSHFSNLIFRSLASVGGAFVTIEIGKMSQCNRILEKLLCLISYASMVSYLFHRQFFGAVQIVFGKYQIVFAYFVVLPVMIMGSYFVQYYYDRIINRINEKQHN